MKKENESGHRSGCPINLTLEVVGDKWSLLIIRDMIFGNRRHFRELLLKSEEGIASNILAGLMDARVSIVSNNLNLTMKTLTIITLTIMVPTFVVSAFSMNVTIPLEKEPWAFWLVMGLAVSASVAFLLWGRYKRW